MALEPPSGFVDLYAASNQYNRDISIIGVVTDVLPPTRSKGSDWMLTFSITDSTITGHEYAQKVRIFNPTQAGLPAVQGTGDVIMLWNVKVKEWSGMSIVISNRATSWLVFPSSCIPEKPPPSGVQIEYLKSVRAPIPTGAQMLYATSLCNSQDRETFSAFIRPNLETKSVPLSSLSSNITGSRQKFSLIKDVAVDTYYDLVGQVVKVYPNNGRVELYITDYTSNGLLYNYEWGREGENAVVREGDPYGHISRGVGKKWRGPFGKMTLTVTLWDPHAYYTQNNVKEDQFVFLRNVHIKWSRDAKVEGVLHTDKRYPSRIDITILDTGDDRVKDVLRRKRDYAAKFKMQSEELVGEARGQKRKQSGEGEALSKNQLRKRRKQERELAKREQCKTKQDLQDGGDERNARATIFPKLELNKNSMCYKSKHADLTPNLIFNQSPAPTLRSLQGPSHLFFPVIRLTRTQLPTAYHVYSLFRTSALAPPSASWISFLRSSKILRYGTASQSSTSYRTTMMKPTAMAVPVPATKIAKMRVRTEAKARNGNGGSVCCWKTRAPSQSNRRRKR